MSTRLTYTHHTKVPSNVWLWENFSPAEIACRGTGTISISREAMDRLQRLRKRLGKPLIVNSAYRSPEHNRNVGGAPQSKHMDGTAFDISMSNHDPEEFIRAARAEGFVGIGTYPRSNFIHIDLGPARVWGDPFPKRAVPFAPEKPPVRESLAGSRTIAGAVVTTAGTAGGAALEIVTEAREGIEPVAGAFSGLQMLFVLLALAGVALTIYARVSDHKAAKR